MKEIKVERISKDERMCDLCDDEQASARVIIRTRQQRSYGDGGTSFNYCKKCGETFTAKMNSLTY